MRGERDVLELHSEHLQRVRVLPLQLVAALPLSLALPLSVGLPLSLSRPLSLQFLPPLLLFLLVLILLFLHVDALTRRLLSDQNPCVATLTTQLWTKLKTIIRLLMNKVCEA